MTELYIPDPFRDAVVVRFDDGTAHALTRDGLTAAPATLFPTDLVWSPDTARDVDAELERAEAEWDAEHGDEVEEAERVAYDNGFDAGKAEGLAEGERAAERAERAAHDEGYAAGAAAERADGYRRAVQLVDAALAAGEITALVAPEIVDALGEELRARVEAAFAPVDETAPAARAS